MRYYKERNWKIYTKDKEKRTMLVGVMSAMESERNQKVNLEEKEIDRSASEYIQNHYDSLLKYVRNNLKVCADKANDLLHDVYISVVQAESNGEPFCEEYVSRNGEEINITVETFIHRRLSLYSRGAKYSNNVVESKKITTCEWHVYDENVIDREGNVIGKRTVKKKKNVESRFIVSTADLTAESQDDEGHEINNSFQYAYARAATQDGVDDIAEFVSLRDEISFCIDICSGYGIDIVGILKNIDYIVDRMDAIKENTNSRVDKSDAFKKLRRLVKYHDEFGEALRGIIEYAAVNRAGLDTVLATF